MSKIYWFTGQPGAGKTVIAKRLKEFLLEFTYGGVFHVDGDDLRDLIQNKDYSREGRVKNIQLAQSIAKYLFKQDQTVIVSLVSPYLDIREAFKNDMESSIVEIYVHTSETRGREHFHVEDYQPPITNFISLDTTDKTEEETFKELLDKL